VREVLRRCFCVRRSVRSVLCYETRGDPITLQEKLSCGEPCHKQLARCNHRCSQRCHPGECTASVPLACRKKVSLRCACKRIKTEVKCDEAQRLRGDRARTENQLLACDEGCAALRRERELAAKQAAEEKARALALEKKQVLRCACVSE
jgi:NF-X1-type zinc finger protein NFXL1